MNTYLMCVSRVPHLVSPRSYVAPGDASAGCDAGHAAAGRLVRGLLRTDPRDRTGAAAAVAALEVLLFVLPAMPHGASVLPALPQIQIQIQNIPVTAQRVANALAHTLTRGAKGVPVGNDLK